MWVKNHFLKVTCTKNDPVQLYLFQIMTLYSYQGVFRTLSNIYIGVSLGEKCSKTEFFVVRIFLFSGQEKLRIWTLFTQCLS